jgi:hypothetical protein
VPEWTDETARQFRLARASAAQMARTYAEAGFAVAIDDVIGPDEAQALLAEPLADFPAHKVVLRPTVEATLARNAARTHKQFDTAVLEGAIRSVYDSADMEAFAAHGWQILDTTALTLGETVEAILAEATRERPPAERQIDKRGVLDEDVFSYRASKDKVFIFWHGKQVMTLKGREASRFLSKIDGLEGKQAQLVMAKITGNFKRGNER